MCEINHKEIVEREEKGEILIGIDAAVARRFFTYTDHRAVQQEIGEAVFIERFFVKAFFSLGVISLLTGIVASIFAIKWWSVLTIPLMILGWFILGGRASMGTQKLGGAVASVIMCSILAYYLRDKGIAVTIWIILLPLPYFFDRLTYKSATVFLRCLSIRNERAFTSLYNKGIFLREV